MVVNSRGRWGVTGMKQSAQRTTRLPGKLGKKRHPANLIDTRSIAELEALFLEKGHGLTEQQIKHVSRVPLGTLWMAPAVFQPRDPDERDWEKEKHIATLSGYVNSQKKELD